VLTFALMDNHFHILAKIPKPCEVDELELVRRMRVLYGDSKTDRVLHDWEVWERKGLTFKVQAAKAALRRRMHDLSQFCKTLKETCSMSYNFRNAHSGTIWGSHFKSILLSPDYETLMSVGAYIDVRSGVGRSRPGKPRRMGDFRSLAVRRAASPCRCLQNRYRHRHRYRFGLFFYLVPNPDGDFDGFEPVCAILRIAATPDLPRLTFNPLPV